MRRRHRHYIRKDGWCRCGHHRFGAGTFCQPMRLALAA